MAKLTELVSDYFNSGVRSRGSAYFVDGLVQLHAFDADACITASIEGTYKYTVLLEFNCQRRSWQIGAACDCPYANDDLCKHIWATLLAIEKERELDLACLGTIPSSVSIGLLDDEDDRVFDDVEDEFPDDVKAMFESMRGTTDDAMIAQMRRTLAEGMRGRSSGPHPPGMPSAGRASSVRKANIPPPPAWRAFLRNVPSRIYDDDAHRTRHTSPIEPIYVLEVDEAHYKRAPVLSLMHRQITPTGRLGKAKSLSLESDDTARILDEADRQICMMLLGAVNDDDPYRSYRSSRYGSARSRWELSPPVQRELLPRMARTGRLMLRDGRDDDPRPLTFDEGPAWELCLSIQSYPKRRSFKMVGQLRRGQQRCDLAGVEHFIQGSPALFVRDGVLSTLDAHDCFGWIDALNSGKPMTMPKEDVPLLLEELSRRDTFPRIEWPPECGITEVYGVEPKPALALHIPATPASGRREPARATATFRYDECSVEADRPGRMLVDTAGRAMIRRQLDKERQLVDRLLELGARRSRYEEGFRVPPKSVPALITTLLDEGWTIRGNQKLYRQPGEFNVRVSSGIDWFDVAGTVDFGGQVAHLPELLKAVREGERFVLLDDGSFGLLPEQWLARHRAWFELGQAQDDSVRFSSAQLCLIDALLAELPEATVDENLAAARQKLARFSGIKPGSEPADFAGQLRPYQRDGLGWLRFLDEFQWGGCLADDMGLGKTVQFLALLADRDGQECRHPSLVVAPKSVIFNWIREAQRFAPRLRVLDYTGTERKATRDTLPEQDLVLTTYGTLRRDVKFLREQTFNYVVLDEAQAIKNPQSQNAKCARLLPARRRLALTGTPVENELGDLWSLFEFLNPGMLGTVKAFRSFSGNGRGDGDASQLPVLRRMLRPFILRRTKEQVATDLPERSEQTVDCEMPTRQAAYYKELLDHYRTTLLARIDESGLAKSKMHVLEALLRLRQAACHPGLIDESKVGAASGKLDTLLPMLTELAGEGHKALVFSQFTKMLAIVRTALDAQGLTYEYLDGRTTDRAGRVDRFQSDEACPLFLISLKAGGTGLNLTAADYVFILDPWWNPAVEAQAIDRAHRIGQSRKVIAYRLIAGAIESKILELQQSKRELADAIITQQNSVIRNLTRDDLAALLA